MSAAGICAQLHGASPYAGHDVSAHPGDMQGWVSDAPVFRTVIEALRPRIIVEVGTWKGASAIHMGQIVRSLGLETTIMCIDTWLGSPEHFLGAPEVRGSLRPKNGYPQLYFTFLTNVIEHGLTDAIVPLPTTSENAAVILNHHGIRPDLVYIDAAHQYEAVKRDIEMYWDLLSADGVLLGDDYNNAWPGVMRVADLFATDERLRMVVRDGKYLFAKNPEFLQQVAQ